MPFIELNEATAQAAPATTLGAPKLGWGMSLIQLRGELDSMLGGRADIPTSRYDLWINMAYRDLCTSLDIDELKGSLSLALVAEQPAYLLPAVIDTIRQVSITLPEAESTTGGYPLDKNDLLSYRQLIPDGGEPRLYFRYTSMLVLYPTPNAARSVVIDARIRPADLVADADCPLLGSDWHEGILLGAAWRAYRALREFPSAASAQNDYVSFLRRRTDREAAEDENRIIGTSVPRRVEDLRNTVRRPYGPK